MNLLSALDLLISFLLDLVNSLLNGSLDFYSQVLFLTPITIVTIYLLMFLGNLILTCIYFILPWLEKIIVMICFPFRLMHIYFHIWEIKRQQREHIFQDSKFGNLSAGFYTGIGNSERSSINASFKKSDVTIKEAFKIASAPSKGTFILAFFLALMTPTLLAFGRTGLIIHLYFSVAGAGVLSPDRDDYTFCYNIIILKSDISPFYLLYTIFIGSFWFYVGLGFSKDIGFALFLGLLISLLYLFTIIIVATKKTKEDEFFIFNPDKKEYTDNLLVMESLTADLVTSSEIE